MYNAMLGCWISHPASYGPLNSGIWFHRHRWGFTAPRQIKILSSLFQYILTPKATTVLRKRGLKSCICTYIYIYIFINGIYKHHIACHCSNCSRGHCLESLLNQLQLFERSLVERHESIWKTTRPSKALEYSLSENDDGLVFFCKDYPNKALLSNRCKTSKNTK